MSLAQEVERPAGPRTRLHYRPELDGVRALAVAAVFASHVGYGRMVGGWIGVGVFFVLSGYLITTILMLEWQRTGGIALRRFYGRRLLRLYPVLVLMLLLGALFAPVFGDGGTAAGYLVSAAFTGLYLQDFVVGFTGSAHGLFLHTWSLAVEEQFYLVWPPVLILVLRRGRSVLAWALAGTAASWALLVLTTAPRGDVVPATYALPWTRAGELLLGCALAAWLARRPPVLDSSAARRWAAPAGGLGLVLLALVAGKAGLSPWLPLQIIVTALLAAALITGLVADRAAPAARVLSWPPLARAGRISYGLYLFHLPVLVVVERFAPIPWAAQVGLAALVTVGLAAASYRFVEQPLKSWATPVLPGR